MKSGMITNAAPCRPLLSKPLNFVFKVLKHATMGNNLYLSLSILIFFHIASTKRLIMGKKSRRNKGSGDATVSASATLVPPAVSTNVPAATSTDATEAPAAVYYYPSDGPSDVEQLQTTSTSLQAKLNQLTELGLANNRAEFVQHFVPLDLSEADQAAYLQDLTTAPEAEGQWRNLVAEIAAIRSGKGVDRIEGDQQTRAIFHFRHPLLEKCDREVAFVCVGGEWRADG
jgi:hypothetical protein